MDITNYISEDQQTVTIQLKAVPVKEGCCNCDGCFFEDDGILVNLLSILALTNSFSSG